MLQVVTGGIQLRELVDIGSTHTFIHSKVACRLGLPVTPRDSLSVMVANRDRVYSPGVRTTVDVTMHDERFAIDCFAQPTWVRPHSRRSMDTNAGVHRPVLRRPFDGILVQQALASLDRHGQSGHGCPCPLQYTRNPAALRQAYCRAPHQWRRDYTGIRSSSSTRSSANVNIAAQGRDRVPM